MIEDDLRRCFVRSKKHHDPNYFLPKESKYSKSFDKAGEICEDMQVHPEIYIAAHFSTIDPDKLIPPFLHSKNSRDLVNLYIKQSAQTYASKLYIQKIYLDQMMFHGQITEEQALMSNLAKFDPWFRICISEQPIPAVIEKYKEKAKEQLKDGRLTQFLVGNKLDYKRILT